MGMYSTYSDLALSRELVRLEQELVSIKSPQVYGTQQTVPSTENSLTFRPKRRDKAPDGNAPYCVAVIVKFTGVYLEKTAIASVKARSYYDWGEGSSRDPGLAFFRSFLPATEKYELRFGLVIVSTSGDNWYARIDMSSNMPGSLVLEKQYTNIVLPGDNY